MNVECILGDELPVHRPISEGFAEVLQLWRFGRIAPAGLKHIEFPSLNSAPSVVDIITVVPSVVDIVVMS